jgi:PTS system mannose-specific IIA component
VITGVLLVTHQGIASSMMKIARQIWNDSPAHFDYIEIEFDADIRQLTANIEHKISVLDQGNGVLVLSDLIGATPCNLASNISKSDIIIITGLNLPMLIRAYNYRQRPLVDLAQIAREGAQRGICQLSHDNCVNMKEM